MRNMLYAGVAGAAMILGASGAFAADLYTPPPPEQVIAPAPVPVGGWYVGVFGGAAFPLSMDTEGAFYDESGPVTALYGFDGKTHFDTGWLVGGNIGYEMGNGLRGEIEVSYMQAGNDKLKGTFYEIVDVDGDTFVDEFGVSAKAKDDLSATFVLANLWYDFNMGGLFKPYIGGGVGVAFVDQSLKVGGVKWIDDSTTNFAFQAGGGIKWALSEAIDLDLGYRFKGALDAKLKDSGAYVYPGGVDAYAAQTKDDLFIHTVQAGLTFRFGGY
ncbi:outer membrane protein [Rhodoligotrophos defluvii]|uniref:outer membrane protein n=1 Tax=Rhodoligotrophos defluvii TaxID=2561934 RepID=UPI0010C9E29E|nr:outer membrane beta-barrel protein [Rhodoligotrophos defluvii]